MARIAVEERSDPETAGILDSDTLDPRMHYRFIQVRPKRIASAKRAGYKPVDRKRDGVRTLVEGDQDDGTGAIVDGDTVLMMIPREAHRRRRLASKQRRIGRLRSADRRFRQLAAQSGVTVAEENTGKEPKGPGD